MCFVSVMIDYGKHRVQPQTWTPQVWETFKTHLDGAAELDKVLKQPDCVDPEKEKWVQAMDRKYRSPFKIADEVLRIARKSTVSENDKRAQIARIIDDLLQEAVLASSTGQP